MSSGERHTVHVAAIDVGDVGDAVKGEKRDADRQQYLDERQLVLQAQQVGELVRRPDQEIEIFEDAEHQ